MNRATNHFRNDEFEENRQVKNVKLKKKKEKQKTKQKIYYYNEENEDQYWDSKS